MKLFSRSRGLFWLACCYGFPLVCAHGAEWETWKNCRLSTTGYYDGDSFHVIKDGKDRIFRLYAVDTAETSEEFPDRVREQQDYFKASKEEILAAGEEAEEFTRRLLQKPFSVETQWVDAKGASRQQRFFAKITLADGSDLGLRLVEAGLARSYGMRHGLPFSYLGKLDRAESSARAARRGVWGGKDVELPVDEAADDAEQDSEPAGEILDTQSIFNSLQRDAAIGSE